MKKEGIKAFFSFFFFFSSHSLGNYRSSVKFFPKEVEEGGKSRTTSNYGFFFRAGAGTFSGTLPPIPYYGGEATRKRY